jgi:hypothetical protein
VSESLTPLTDATKARIDTALSVIPEGKRGALLLVADEQGTRAYLAARLGDHWQLAAGAGVAWEDRKPYGFVALQASW